MANIRNTRIEQTNLNQQQNIEKETRISKLGSRTGQWAEGKALKWRSGTVASDKRETVGFLKRDSANQRLTSFHSELKSRVRQQASIRFLSRRHGRTSQVMKGERALIDSQKDSM